jgi:RNA polymerase sigma-70 factor (ECF subfamily)
LETSTSHNERELLDLTAQGDENAFSRLFYLWHQKLGAYIHRLTGSTELTEEIVQDVFMKVWDNREKLIQIACFSAYLYVLSRNHTYNCLRQVAKERSANRALIEKKWESGHVEDPSVSAPDYYGLIDKAVASLPPQQQKVYILSRRERLKYDEIAAVMNISRETVKKYLQIATHAIQGYIRSHGDMLMLFILLAAPGVII